MPDSPVREEAAIERARRWCECYEKGVTLGGEPCLRDELVWDAPTLVADLLALTASDRSEIEQLRAERGALRAFVEKVSKASLRYSMDSESRVLLAAVGLEADELLLAAVPVSSPEAGETP